MDKVFGIEIPQEPGIYESEMFQIGDGRYGGSEYDAYELTHDGVLQYYNFTDRKSISGYNIAVVDGDGNLPEYISGFGPFRKVGESVPSEKSRIEEALAFIDLASNWVDSSGFGGAAVYVSDIRRILKGE